LTYPELLAKANAITAGDTHAAQALLDDIGHVLDSQDLSTDQRRNLYKLRKKWSARASGADTRWLTFGSAPGNKSRKRTRDGDKYPSDDPLVESIIRKYGSMTPEGNI
jgi:hypothetical protein